MNNLSPSPSADACHAPGEESEEGEPTAAGRRATATPDHESAIAIIESVAAICPRDGLTGSAVCLSDGLTSTSACHWFFARVARLRAGVSGEASVLGRRSAILRRFPRASVHRRAAVDGDARSLAARDAAGLAEPGAC